MKKLFIYASFAALLGGCTKDFNSINTDPTRASAVNFDPNLLLPSIQFNYASGNAGYNAPLLFQSMWIQGLASTTSGSANYYLNADKYVSTTGTPGYISNAWNIVYSGASYAEEMQNLTAGNGNLANLNSLAHIMKVLCIQYITDIYGDCPYSQGLQAKAGITLPVYDKQQDIYNRMLNELDSAINKLDPSLSMPANDAFPYKGNIIQWKRFGYSLMLKIAMRLTKVDVATAQKWAEKAAAGGTFESIADDAYLVCDNTNGYGNPYGSALNTPGDIYEVRWSKTLINYLRTNKDPRLGIIGEVPAAGLANNKVTSSAINTDSSAQIGLPNGYDLNGGATDISKSPGYPGGTGTGNDFTPIGKYSRPRTSMYRNLNAPIYVLTYAETQFLLSEAAARGWNIGGISAAQHFWNALSAGLQSLSVFGSDASINAATANAYATAHPLDISSLSNSLKQINEAYWATDCALFNFVEAWNNWKRSGYPVLTPVNYPGNFSSGQIPRRELYPPSESTLNPANYKAAVNDLSGGDNWTSRMWWDK